MALISDLVIAIITATGTNPKQLGFIRERLEQAGIRVVTASSESEEVMSAGHDPVRVKVDQALHELHAFNLDGIVIPELNNISGLDANPHLVPLITGVLRAGKPLGIIGSAIELLCDSELLYDKIISAPESVSRRVDHAGGDMGFAPVTNDEGLITCTDERYLDRFLSVYLNALAEHIRKEPLTYI